MSDKTRKYAAYTTRYSTKSATLDAADIATQDATGSDVKYTSHIYLWNPATNATNSVIFVARNAIRRTLENVK
jgi:hypothetical protein